MFITISRSFGQEGVGLYTFAMALTGFFAVFADFGLYHLSVRQISLDVNSQALSGHFIVVRTLFNLTAFALFVVVAELPPFFGHLAC